MIVRMPRSTVRLLSAAALLVAVVALAVWRIAPGDASGSKSPGVHTQSKSPAPKATRSVGFRTRTDLVEHFRKHGREFGSITMDEYLARAQALRDRRAGGAVLEIVRGDGTVARFDRGSGAFVAFRRDGVIRTFFRPADGERYFRRQAARYGGNR
jgi:hypothetical protein